MGSTIKTSEQHYRHHPGMIIVNLEDISQFIVGSPPLASVMYFFGLKYIV